MSSATKAATEYFTNTPYVPKPKKDWMTLQHLKKTCFDWAMAQEGDKYVPLKIDGAKTTELKFAIPYMQTPRFEIHLSGTIDSIRQVNGGGPYIVLDYKTTSSWDTKEYLNNYKLDPQLPFYRLAIQKYAELYPNSIFGTMIQKGIGCCIEGIFISSAKDTIIQRSDVMFFKAEFMQRFEKMLRQKIQALIDYLEADTLPEKEGLLTASCYGTKFGPCAFANACGAPDSIAEGHILRSQFIQKTYDPRNFR
jgi:hypothetical protein